VDTLGGAKWNQFNLGAVRLTQKRSLLYAVSFYETDWSIDSTGKQAVLKLGA
jgi:hypothetical protein